MSREPTDRAAIDDLDLLLRTVGADRTLAPESSGRRWRALCPFHAESTGSFVIWRPDGRHAGYYCFGCGASGHNAVDYVIARDGCDFAGALVTLGLAAGRAPARRAVVTPPPVPSTLPKSAPRGTLVETRDFRRADGTLAYQECKYAPKSFRQRRPDGAGGWIYHLDGVELVPYRLPELLAESAARAADPLWLCEGPKDADRGAAGGLLATSKSGGAGAPLPPALLELARGRTVIVCYDNDDKGRVSAAMDAADLRAAGATVKVLDLAAAWPELPEKGDLSDFLDRWHPDALRALANYAPALPVLDPTVPGLLQDADPVDSAVVGELAARLLAVESELTETRERLDWTDRVLTQPGLDTSDRVGTILLDRYCEEQGLAAGGSIATTQVALAKRWGVNASTVSRWLEKQKALGRVDYHVNGEVEIVTDRHGAPVRDPQTQALQKRHHRQTVLAFRVRPREVSIPVQSPPGKSGKQHGGYRPKCPACGAAYSAGRSVRACKCGTLYDPRTGQHLATLDMPIPVEETPTPAPPRSQRDAGAGAASVRVAAAARRSKSDPCPSCGRTDGWHLEEGPRGGSEWICACFWQEVPAPPAPARNGAQEAASAPLVVLAPVKAPGPNGARESVACVEDPAIPQEPEWSDPPPDAPPRPLVICFRDHRAGRWDRRAGRWRCQTCWERYRE